MCRRSVTDLAGSVITAFPISFANWATPYTVELLETLALRLLRQRRRSSDS